jgi:hypothetical protein
VQAMTNSILLVLKVWIYTAGPEMIALSLAAMVH